MPEFYGQVLPNPCHLRKLVWNVDLENLFDITTQLSLKYFFITQLPMLAARLTTDGDLFNGQTGGNHRSVDWIMRNIKKQIAQRLCYHWDALPL